MPESGPDITSVSSGVFLLILPASLWRPPSAGCPAFQARARIADGDVAAVELIQAHAKTCRRAAVG
jgi:hypothetical protein